MKARRDIDEIFNDALELDGRAREAFLDEACTGDASIRQRLDRLLARYESMGSFMRSPSTRASQASNSSPAQIPDTEVVSGRLLPGRILGDRYRVEERLGQGGMGEVWRAFDLKLRVDVALKSLLPELLTTKGREYLRAEVRAAREVVSPNVCRVFDLVVEDGQEFVSMEYVDGRTLTDLLTENAPLELRDASEMAAQLLSGLEAIHDAGLVHRDLKPDNVMITRSGRVVVMDFGIARAVTEPTGMTIAGTPAYMAPEQQRGDELDARSDIFAVGVILAEMATLPDYTMARRKELWSAVRENPPRLSDDPWAQVLERAVAWDPAARFASARALSRALEEATLRVEGKDDRNPYPGLAAFTEEDAEYFFGREAEVETIWKNLQKLHLSAIIGTSGVGKSSLVRAGLVTAAPRGWQCVVCTPGSAPFTGVAQALVGELAGDEKALRQLLELHEPSSAVAVLHSWRQKHDEALLIIDQFEELFTLNPPEVQASFAQMLSALAMEADVHVLLSMRDDFLIRCKDFGALAPIFSELTAISPLTGSALRRALVQPALACGYRFEDESLVDEMVKQIRDERGALPLLAFAASKLWERRDRSTGILRREAYEEIGGVGGALAKHAEETLERIGTSRVEIVRELFRNLVTSEGTRAIRETTDLLTVFEEPERARAILGQLVDARLLTTFDAPGTEEEEEHGGQRVEIIHESLLSAWPRLVRWQSQDADSARLRDQLRQAARLWEDRHRSDDLLWTGTAFQEFELWRDHYPGGLTQTEEAFAQAMDDRATRQRRRRRITITTAFTVLLVVLAVVGGLWQRSVRMNRQSEARRFHMLAEKVLDYNNSRALVCAIASLERVDDRRVRVLAVEALGKGPTIFEPPVPEGSKALNCMAFSPDGKWMAAPDPTGRVLVWPSDGGPVVELEIPGESGRPTYVEFSPDGSLLACSAFSESQTTGLSYVLVWSFPSGELLRSWEFDTRTYGYLRREGVLLTASQNPGVSYLDEYQPLWRIWPLDGGEPTILGRANSTTAGQRILDVDPTGQWLADWRDQTVYLFPLDSLETGQPIRVGSHEAEIRSTGFSPDGRLLASWDKNGKLRVWSLDGDPRLLREIASNEWISLTFDPGGRRLVGGTGIASIWDLEGPPAAEPLQAHPGWNYTSNLSFDPTGRWLAVPHMFGPPLRMYPVTRQYPLVLKPDQVHSEPLLPTLSPDGRVLAMQPDREGTLALCELDSPDLRQEVLFRNPMGRALNSVAFDGAGKNLAVGCFIGGLWLVPRNENPPRELEGPNGPVISVDFSPSDRWLAASVGGFGAPARLHVWDLQSEETLVLDWAAELARWIEGDKPGGGKVLFLSETELAFAGGGLGIWDLESGDVTVLHEGDHSGLALSENFLVSVGPDGVVLYDRASLEPRRLPFRNWQDGNVFSLAIDPNETFVAIGLGGGAIEVLYLDEEEPHVLIRNQEWVTSLHVDSQSEWITAAGTGEVRIWPVPSRGQPLLSRPRDEFLAVLRAQTNLGVVMDPEKRDGFRIEPVRWNGWETVPTW